MKADHHRSDDMTATLDPHADDEPGIRGILEVIVRDPGGALVDRRRVHNLITTAGRKFLVRALTTGAVDVKLQIAVGRGQSPPRIENSALDDMLARADVREWKFAEPLSDGRLRIILHAELPAADDVAHSIREAGLLVSHRDDGPILFNRALLPVLTWTRDVSLSLDWEITL